MMHSLSSCTSFLRSKIRTLTSTGKLENHLLKVYREQLQNNANKGMYFVKVNYEDLMNFDEGLASMVKTYPNDFLPLVRSVGFIFLV